jgi:uncharacterized membrane protein YphA (DoxX/SURF4 family)
MNILFISILILLLFFVSGIEKIFTFNKTVTGFMKQTSFPISVCYLAILIAILIEVISPLIIWYESYTGKQVYSYYALISLILFTILATIIYHRNDISGIIKNISIIGGLLLLIKFSYP